MATNVGMVPTALVMRTAGISHVRSGPCQYATARGTIWENTAFPTLMTLDTPNRSLACNAPPNTPVTIATGTEAASQGRLAMTSPFMYTGILKVDMKIG